MGRLKIYKDNYSDATAVSNIFIDEYMKDANDAQLKIYLYLIRIMNADQAISITDIADKFNHTEKDVLRALSYWEKKKLLTLEYSEDKSLTGIHLLNFEKKAGSEQKTLAPVVSLVAKTAPAPETGPEAAMDEEDLYFKPSYSPNQLKEFKSNEESSQLLFIAEQYIGKTLSPSEIKSVLFISDRLSFSADLIDYLIQYCVDRGKKDFRYIEKVAVNWAQAGITTPKDAERHSGRYDKTIYEIMKALGKSNDPTPREVDYMNRWTRELGYEMDVIAEACARTVMSTEKHRFEYADSILKSWFSSGVHHKSDIAKADEGYRSTKPAPAASKSAAANKFNQFKQNSYDFDTLEKELLSN